MRQHYDRDDRPSLKETLLNLVITLGLIAALFYAIAGYNQKYQRVMSKPQHHTGQTGRAGAGN